MSAWSPPQFHRATVEAPRFLDAAVPGTVLAESHVGIGVAGVEACGKGQEVQRLGLEAPETQERREVVVRRRRPGVGFERSTIGSFGAVLVTRPPPDDTEVDPGSRQVRIDEYRLSEPLERLLRVAGA